MGYSWSSQCYVCSGTKLGANHKPYFASEGSKVSYFQSRAVRNYNNFSFIRERRNYIKVPDTLETFANCDSVIYRNANTGNKWYICRILSKEYVSDINTYIYVEFDPFMTWQQDVDFSVQNYVLREHVEVDTPGRNMQPEPFNIDRYKRTFITQTGLNELKYVMLASTSPDGGDADGWSYGGFVSPMEGYSTPSQASLNTFIDLYRSNFPIIDPDVTENIIMIYTVAEKAMANNGKIVGSQSPQHFNVPVSVDNSTIDNYTPRNKKLLQYPFKYIQISNNQGGLAEFRIEEFNTGAVNFRVLCDVSPDPVYKIFALDYQGVYNNYDECLTLSGFPMLPWTTDAFSSWLSQHTGQLASSAASLAIGAATGGVGLAVGAANTLNTAGQLYDQANTPPNVHGSTNSGSVNSTAEINDFYIYNRFIRAELARSIDYYFDKFGYSINELKTANYNNRPYWNYILCQDAHFPAPCAKEYQQEIDALFNSGVTLWHIDKGATVGAYGLDNSI